ncbi:MAG: hypothetical protein R8M46_02650 [Ghiorsea sp.]
MIGKRLPGSRSNITLLITSTWAFLGLSTLIIGHLSLVFIMYGLVKDIDGLAELESFFPLLSQTLLYLMTAAALILDVWIYVSHKKQLQHKIQR